MDKDMFNLFVDLDDSEFMTELRSVQQSTYSGADNVSGDIAEANLAPWAPTAEDERLFNSIFQTNADLYGAPNQLPATDVTDPSVDAAGSPVDERRTIWASDGRPLFTIPDALLPTPEDYLHNGDNDPAWQIQHNDLAQTPERPAQPSAIDSQQVPSYQGYSSAVGSQAIGNNLTGPSPIAPLDNLRSSGYIQRGKQTS